MTKSALGDSSLPCPLFVISLSRATERRMAIKQRLDVLGLTYQIIDACDGEKMPKSDYASRLNDEFWRINRGRRLSPSEIGCYLSHYGVWQKIVVDKIPHAVILEDDAVLTPDFAEIVRHLCVAPVAWDMIIFHSKNNYAFDSTVYDIPASNRKLVLYSRRIGQAVAYLITVNAAERLVDYCAKIRAPIDWLTAEWWHHGLKYYGVYPPVAQHNREESTIQVFPRYSRTLLEHISAMRYRLSDWALRRQMLRKIKLPTKE